MANDKDFIVKNAVEVGGATKVTVGDAASAGSYTAGYDLSVAAYDSVRFDIQSQDTSAQAVRFGDSGTKMYIMGYTNKRVYQYTLTTAYDISTASYASKNLLVSGEDTSPLGIDFKTDGTKMYMSGNGQIYQYTLSTAWDVSTGSFDNVSFSTTSQDTSPRSVLFKSDGLSMYITGAANDAVYQYNLSTAWDLSTASYASKSYSIPFTNAVPEALAFNGDGTQMFITNSTEDKVDRFNLSTAYDVSTASDPSINFSYASEINVATGLLFNSDGTKMILLASNSVSGNDAVFQYSTGSTVTTGSFDLSTGNYFIDTPSADVEYTFSNAGDVQSFQLEVTGNQDVVPYSLSALTYDSVSFSVSSQDTNPEELEFSSDGTKMYVLGDAGDDVNEYTLSTAWDISTATYSTNFVVSSQESGVRGMAFKADGTKFYICGFSNDTIYQYSMSTAWDLSTASYDSVSKSVSSQFASPVGIFFKPDGTKMYISGYTGSTWVVGEYNLSTAWSVSTATYSQQFSVATQASSAQDVMFKPDGSLMYVIHGSSIHEYSLSTAWDVSSSSFVQTATISEDTNASGFALKSDGTKIFVIGNSSDTVYQYTSASSTAITITWDADIQWAGGNAPDSPAAGEKDLYTITTDDGGTTYIGVQSGDAFS